MRRAVSVLLLASLLSSAVAAAQPEAPSPALRVVTQDEALAATVEDELRAAGYRIGEDGTRVGVHVGLYRQTDHIRVVVLRAGTYCGESIIATGAHGGIGDQAASSLRAAEAVRSLLASCPKAPSPAPAALIEDPAATPAHASRPPPAVTPAVIVERVQSTPPPPDDPHPRARFDVLAQIDTLGGGPMFGLGVGLSGYLSSYARIGAEVRYGFYPGKNEYLNSFEVAPGFDFDLVPDGRWVPTLGAELAGRFMTFTDVPQEPTGDPPDCCSFSTANQFWWGPRARFALAYRGPTPTRFALAIRGGFDYGGWRLPGDGTFSLNKEIFPVFGVDLRVGFDLGLPEEASAETAPAHPLQTTAALRL